MENVLIVRYGEIALRGKNKGLFIEQLLFAIKKNLAGLGKYYIVKELGRLIVERHDGELDENIIPNVLRVLGIASVSPALRIEDQSLENICKEAARYFEKTGNAVSGTTFKVETKRGNKRYPMTSNQVSAAVGEYLLNQFPDLKVDVHHPDHTVCIELRNQAYLYCEKYAGPGGLPVGSSGWAVALLSGGIDSPVAAYLMAKRGVAIEGVYFHSPPYTSEWAKQKVKDLAQQLALYTGSFGLTVVPFTAVQLYLLENVPHDKLTIFLKRAMLHIGQSIAEKRKAQCLVVGDSVGQVASQTLHGIQAVSEGMSLPILRPLAGYDKQEIVNLAQKIETYPISIRPYEDCCTIFVDKHPETRPKASVICAIEKHLEQLEALLLEAEEQSERLQF